MSQESREVAKIRQELRERLMTERHEGVADVLQRLRHMVERHEDRRAELRGEYERWKLRFELLQRLAAAAATGK